MYQYYPVVFTAFWLEHKLWGLNPSGYHIVNLILHILNALLVFRVVSKLYPRLAFICALFFAIHPIQVETVAWITERKNLLALFFFLLAVLSYLRFDRTRKIRDYLSAFIMFVCAILSKPVAICFIFFPVLYKWWRDGKFTWREIRLSILFVLTGLLGALYMLYLELYNVGAQGKAFHLTFLERFILSGRTIFFYIYKLIFPVNFMFFYPRWIINTHIWWQWLFISAVMLALIILVYYRKNIGRGALALFIFYLISIFPVTGFLNVYGMKFSFVADHFSYLSTPALLLLLCGLATFFSDGFKRRFMPLNLLPYKITQRILLCTVVIYMCAQSALLTRNYKDLFIFWNSIIKSNPKLAMAYNNRGNIYYYQQGDIDRALSDYNKAIEIDPDYAYAYNNKGAIYAHLGDFDRAILNFSKAIQADPSQADIYYNLGCIYQNIGDFDKAILNYSRAIEINSDYNKIIVVNPNYAGAYNKRGSIYLDKGMLDQSITDFGKAIEINPNYAEAYYNRAIAYYFKEEYEKSWQDVQAAESLGGKIEPKLLDALSKAIK